MCMNASRDEAQTFLYAPNKVTTPKFSELCTFAPYLTSGTSRLFFNPSWLSFLRPPFMAYYEVLNEEGRGVEIHEWADTACVHHKQSKWTTCDEPNLL